MKNLLDDVERIKELDGSNMHELLLTFSKAIADAETIASRFDLAPSFNKVYSSVVFSGLGGSAIGADFVKSYLEDEINLPIIVNRDYTIPALVGKDTLFIASSYSGNTEETLSAFKAAKEKGADIMVLSSGGKLLDLAVKNGIPFIRIPAKLPPRCALAYGTIPVLNIFSKLRFISSKEAQIKETVKVLSELKDVLGIENAKRKNQAKIIAKRIQNRFPVIYGASRHTKAAVARWRGQLAENAKTVSSSHLLPEMNHNEIVGWENPKRFLNKFVVIFLKDSDDHPRVKLRMEITKSIIRNMKTKVIEVESRGRGLLARLFSLVYIGDWVSFYLAVLNGVDPTPVDRITYLKKKLSE